MTTTTQLRSIFDLGQRYRFTTFGATRLIQVVGLEPDHISWEGVNTAEAGRFQVSSLAHLTEAGLVRLEGPLA